MIKIIHHVKFSRRNFLRFRNDVQIFYTEFHAIFCSKHIINNDLKIRDFCT
jgi:protein involved in sex pheromone biosynthesis